MTMIDMTERLIPNGMFLCGKANEANQMLVGLAIDTKKGDAYLLFLGHGNMWNIRQFESFQKGLDNYQLECDAPLKAYDLRKPISEPETAEDEIITIRRKSEYENDQNRKSFIEVAERGVESILSGLESDTGCAVRRIKIKESFSEGFESGPKFWRSVKIKTSPRPCESW